MAAPNSAIVPGCRLSGPAATKAAMTAPITSSEVRISGGGGRLPRSPRPRPPPPRLGPAPPLLPQDGGGGEHLRGHRDDDHGRKIVYEVVEAEMRRRAD